MIILKNASKSYSNIFLHIQILALLKYWPMFYLCRHSNTGSIKILACFLCAVRHGTI